MVLYRKGRRGVDRNAKGQGGVWIYENALWIGFPKRRNFSAVAVGLTHHAINIPSCRYRNWKPSSDATNTEPKVKPGLF